LAPASIFSKIAATGIRVPRSTHAPLTLPGMLSTAGHCDQSRLAIVGSLNLRIAPACSGRKKTTGSGVHWPGPPGAGSMLRDAAWISSTSARSRVRPEASFAAIRSSFEIKNALRPVAAWIIPLTRRPHTVSKSTLGRLGRISKPRGSRPKRKKLLRSANSSGRMPSSGASNSASAE